MGYLFLAIALFSGAAKGFCGKKISGYTSGYRDAMLANTVRMFLCTAIGIILIAASGSMPYINPGIKVLAISALSGAATSLFVVSWLVAVKKGAYMMVDVFLMLGVLLPLVLGNIFFSESIKWNHWLGLVILLAAVFIMCSYNNSIKEKMNLSSFILLTVCGLANGLADFSQKMFVKQAPDVPTAIFNFYTYVFSAAVLLVFYFIFKNKDNEKKSDDMGLKKVFGYILIMSICLFANSYFKTVAAEYLDSAQLYPVNQGAALIISSVMSAALFKEKLTVKCVVGIVISFAGLLVINLL